MEILKLDNVAFSYDKKQKVFSGLSFAFEDSRVYSIMGRSGAGKTTLLSLLSGLCEASEGTVYVDGKKLSELDKYEYRSKTIGIVFQSFNLLPKLTALENVVLSMDIAKVKDKSKEETAANLLRQVGLDESEINRRVLKLSGGQQQRVAIARAISYNPKIILADEPTGNLDTQTQQEIMDIFKSLAHEQGKCVIIVTHSPDVAKQTDLCNRLEMKKK